MSARPTRPVRSTTNTIPKPAVVEPDSPKGKQGIPKREVASSMAKRGPILFKWLVVIMALCSEQWRIGVKRAANKYSNLEAMIVSKGIAGAEEVRDKGVKKLVRVVEQFDQLRGELSAFRAELAKLPTHPVVGVRGEVLTVQQLESRMAAVSALVTKETDEGSLKHRRVPRLLVRLIPFAVLLDLPILIYFVSEVFNVDWHALGQSVVPLLTSAVFGLLGTASIAVALHYAGRDLKGYKDERGHIALPKGQARVVPLTYLVLSILVAIGSGVTMAFRIMSDSSAAGNGSVAGAILGVFFAVIVMALNVVIWSVNYRDGSTQTDELDHHTRQLLPVRQGERRLEKTIGQAVSGLDRLRTSGAHIYDTTLAKMSDPLKAADQVILQARSYHQGCGIEAELVAASAEPVYGLLLPPKTVDTSVLDNLLQELQRPEDQRTHSAKAETEVEA